MCAGNVGKGWSEVVVEDKLGADLSGGYTGATHSQGYTCSLLIGCMLGSLVSPPAMLAHMRTVVRGEHDVGVPKHASLLQEVEYRTDHLVYSPQGAQLIAMPFA